VRADVDRILISDLSARCIIGVNEDERVKKQEVLINITLFTDLTKPSITDRLEDTVDYRALKKKVLAMVEDSKFFLIEALAGAVAGICLEDPIVSQAVVRVDKPGALSHARSVAVEVTRDRKV
jgi:FolB domain-containing protein